MARPRFRMLVAIVAGLALLAGTPAAASPTSSTQQAVDEYLRAHPGGTQINATEIAYGDGAFIVTVAAPAFRVAASPDCPSGWFCFYDYVNYGYPRGRLSDCGWQDLATWGWQNRVDSVHYNLSVGSVSFIAHGSTANHSNDVTRFSVSSSSRTRADVAPYRNVVDHVYRYC